ncbi:MAG: allophanate hydrolase subunit 1 [Leifsonia sp.]
MPTAPVGGASIRAAGDRALLVDLDRLDAVIEVHAALVSSRPDGVVDIVPAARTVLVTLDPAILPVSSARLWIADAARPSGRPAASTSTGPVVIRVHYGGPDLAALAATIGVPAGDLVRRHQAAEWRVAFSGFAPGFGYLVSTDWTFDVPRLASPRTAVPAGSVGLAGEFTGVYPRESPGGWQLIGRTDAVLWNADAADPALLVPGGVVRFAAADDEAGES